MLPLSDPDSKKEVAFTALVLGVLLAVVFGAANAYLGLCVGLTVLELQKMFTEGNGNSLRTVGCSELREYRVYMFFDAVFADAQ